MQSISVAQLACIVKGELRGIDPEERVERVSIHSARVGADTAFFALRGTRSDGHVYVTDALGNMASIAVVERSWISVDANRQMLIVEDTLAALQLLATWWRSQLTATVVGITGSHGKTVTKDAVASILAKSGRSYASPGSFNSQLGVPLAVLGCPADAEVAIFEAASTSPGEMNRLAAIIRPHHVLITGTTTRYRSGFGSQSKQLEEFASLGNSSPKSGWLLADEYNAAILLSGEANSERNLKVISTVDARLPQVIRNRENRSRSEIAIAFPDGSESELSVFAPSHQILEDVSNAVSISWLLGVGRAEIIESLDEYRPPATRSEISRLSTGASLVRDIASVDPIIVAAGLQVAFRVAGANARVCIVLAEPLVAQVSRVAALADVIASYGVRSVYAVKGEFNDCLVEHLRLNHPSLTTAVADESTIRDILFSKGRSADAILLQSSTDLVADGLGEAFVESVAPTRLTVDLAAIASNVVTFRRLIGSRTKLMAVVKARAYGTSSDRFELCCQLETYGVDAFGVAGADEGIRLRNAGVKAPIVVLLAEPAELDKIFRYGLTPNVYSSEMLAAVVTQTSPLRVHLEVDTGMHRAGFQPTEAIAALERISRAGHITLDGLMAHFASADDPNEDEFTRKQMAVFNEVASHLDRLKLFNVTRHAAATSAAVRFPESRMDMVRIGLGLYGVPVSHAVEEAVDLEGAIALVSRIVEDYWVAAGERIGYGGTFIAPEGGMRIGIVPVGYGEEVSRSFVKHGTVMVGTTQCPIVGRISMDSMAVDLSDASGTSGSEVVIFGYHNGVSVPLQDVAVALDTVPYELMTTVGSRVPRSYTHH